MGKVIQQELPFNWGVPTTQALVPISHYKKAEDNLANLIAGSATPVATLPATTGGSSQSVHTVFNSNTGKYEVKLGDKVLKSFYKEKTAEEFVKRKGADILREQAPVGNVIKNAVPEGGKPPFSPTGYKSVSDIGDLKFDSEKYLLGKIDNLQTKIDGLEVENKSLKDNLKLLTEDHKERIRKHLSKEIDYAQKIEENIVNKSGRGPKMADVYKQSMVPTSTKPPFAPTEYMQVADLKGVKVDAEALNNADDIAKKVDWKKIGKYGLIAAGAAALIGLGVWAYKKYKDSKAEETTPETPVVQPVPTEPETPVVPPTPTEPETPVVPPVPTEPETPVVPVDPNSPVDADGKMTVKKGDGFWHLAERYLTDKFKNEPEKFANLSEKERNTMIHKKMMEIVELYRKQLEAEGKNADVRFEKRIINGKEQTVVVPVIHPGQKIQVVELDKAA